MSYLERIRRHLLGVMQREAEPETITKEARRIIHEQAAEAERLAKEKAERFTAQSVEPKKN